MMNVVGNEDFLLLAMKISYWVCIAITWVFFGLFIRFSGFSGGFGIFISVVFYSIC